MVDEKRKKVVNETVIGMTQSELIQKNGEAASQMMQALKGIRRDSYGNNLNHQGRSLNGISKYKVNSQYADQNIKQQSGFSAELIKEARDNKESILKGDKTRTRTTDGIGQTNNQKYDHIKLDENGNVIEGSGSQMKFYGVFGEGDNSKYKVIDKLSKDPKWDKYDGPVDVPKDQYEGACKYADKQAKGLREQANKLREKGNIDKAKELESKAKKYDEAKKRIRKSNVTSEEAIEARTNPKLFTAKEVVKDCNRAGIDAAKGSAIISGSISIAQNLYAVCAEDKDIDEAVKDIAKTTVSSAAVAYGVGAGGSAIKAFMQASKHNIVARIGTTNMPAMIATGVIQVGKSLTRYAKGEIDELELVEELGEKGVGALAAGFAASAGATLGAAIGSVIPIVGTAVGGVIGGFIGSMIGYNSSSILYNGTLQVLKDEKIAEERRRVIEEISRQAIEETQRYRKALIDYTTNKYNEREKEFSTIFNDIEKSLESNDVNKYINCMDRIGNQFGLKLQFNTFEEIDEFMSDENTVFKI